MYPDTIKTAERHGARDALSPSFLAGGLLVGMTGLAAGTTWLAAQNGSDGGIALDMVRAGAKAGVVGGLADWFAVTALFRHPFGIPVPHTAILPRQKIRLGQALGRFVSGQFFTEQDVQKALAKIDLPTLMAGALEDEFTRKALVSTLRTSIPGLFDRLEDGRASAALSRALPVLLNGEELAPLVSRAMKAMVDSEMHQEVLSFLLAKLKQTVAAKEGDLRHFVEERVREQGGRFVGWAIGSSVANRVLTALQAEIERVDPMDSDIRHGFTAWVRTEIERMESDPERRRDVVAAISSVTTHASLKAWSGELWDRLRSMTEADCAVEDGWSASVLETAVSGLSGSLRDNPVLRERVNYGVGQAVARVLPGLRDKLSGFIANVMAGWDGEDLARRLESRVGRDLAYIRVNGTVVGFLAGAALELLSRVFFGV